MMTYRISFPQARTSAFGTVAFPSSKCCSAMAKKKAARCDYRTAIGCFGLCYQHGPRLQAPACPTRRNLR
jgi:hypothetical protein